MRLLNVKSHQLEEFFGDSIPDYAILSHTWGEVEVTFQGLQHWTHKWKRGYVKIKRTCQLAAEDGLEWVWIDTCCIDKSSSAELSEAINSMFEWYRNSRICYIFLEDVPSPVLGKHNEEAFCKARWFTRGWTLQEFIAPINIKLFDSSWEMVKSTDCSFIAGHFTTEEEPSSRLYRASHFERDLLQHFTGIDRNDWGSADVPTILSWAANRRTSRLEDMAYCLLGLLDVKMPLLYGEGSNAFPRLLEEVIKKSNSHGMLAAWYGMPRPLLSSFGRIFPESPQAYECLRGRSTKTLVPGEPKSLHFSMTNAGLSIELPLVVIDDRLNVVLGLLNYRHESNPDLQIAIVLIQHRDDPYNQTYYRASPPVMVPVNFYQYSKRKNIYITNNPTYPAFPAFPELVYVPHKDLLDIGFTSCSVYPLYPAHIRSLGSEIMFETDFKSKTDTKDPLIILLTTNNDAQNIALYIPKSRGPPGTKVLITLTDAASAIEFLLKDESSVEHPRSTWSTKIDLDNVETRDCWSRDICIPVDICTCVAIPGSREHGITYYRISASFDGLCLRMVVARY